MHISSVLGELLKKARVKAGLSQDDLAARAGYTQTTVSLIERGKRSPSVMTLFDLCGALEISPSKLIAAVERRRK